MDAMMTVISTTISDISKKRNAKKLVQDDAEFGSFTPPTYTPEPFQRQAFGDYEVDHGYGDKIMQDLKNIEIDNAAKNQKNNILTTAVRKLSPFQSNFTYNKEKVPKEPKNGKYGKLRGNFHGIGDIADSEAGEDEEILPAAQQEKKGVRKLRDSALGKVLRGRGGDDERRLLESKK